MMNPQINPYCSVLAVVVLAATFCVVGQAADKSNACIPEPVLYASDEIIVCESMFEDAHRTVENAFASVTAYDEGCDEDLSDDIRVKQINLIKPNGRYEIALDLDEIADTFDILPAGTYDYTVAKTQKLFHYYFIFKPGVYKIHYYIEDDDGNPIDAFRAKREQVIIVGDACSGCLGCLGCDRCAGCRDDYIPGFIRDQDFKRLLGDWLLIGLSLLVMSSYGVLTKR